VQLLDLARRNTSSRPVAEFSCRALRPVYEGSAFALEGAPAADGKEATLWTLDRDEAVGMTATVKFA
jgi:3-methylfumaryl-CoA hydratase